MVEVGHEVFDDGHVRQRGDFDVAFDVVDGFCACEGVCAIDIHGARAADAFAARAAEG